jgi:DNA-binding NarL/FixJ family response regulator
MPNPNLKVVAQAGDGLEVVEAVQKHKPDLVFLDIQMPRMDGLSALRRIKENQPDILALVFSMYEDEAHVVEAIRAGADDYLFKNKATTEQGRRSDSSEPWGGRFLPGTTSIKN